MTAPRDPVIERAPQARVVEDLRLMISEVEYEAEHERLMKDDPDLDYWKQVIEWLNIALAAVRRRKHLPKRPKRKR